MVNIVFFGISQLNYASRRKMENNEDILGSDTQNKGEGSSKNQLTQHAKSSWCFCLFLSFIRIFNVYRSNSIFTDLNERKLSITHTILINTCHIIAHCIIYILVTSIPSHNYADNWLKEIPPCFMTLFDYSRNLSF